MTGQVPLPPSQEPTQGRPAAVTSGPSGRAILGWSAAMLAAVALVAAIGLAWPALRLRYCIHRLEGASTEDLWCGAVSREAYYGWFDRCAQEAAAGNVAAMEATMIPLRRHTDIPEVGCWYLYLAEDQPDLFFCTLGKQGDPEVISTLRHLDKDLWRMHIKRFGSTGDRYFGPGDDPARIRESLMVWARSTKPRAAQVAGRAVAFMQDRFGDRLPSQERTRQ